MENMKYEDALSNLEKLVVAIEDPNRSLVDVSKDVEKAVELIKFCRKKLRSDSDVISEKLNQL